MSTKTRLVTGGFAALLLSPLTSAGSEPTPAALAQEANAALGLSASRVVPVLTAGEAGGPLTVAVELAGTQVFLKLEPISVRAAGFRVLAQGHDGAWTEVPAEPARTYRGEVAGLPGSRVAASLTATGGLDAQVLLSTGESFWMQPLAGVVDAAAPGAHVLYTDDDVLSDGRACGLETLPNPYPSGGFAPTSGSTWTRGGVSAGSALAVAELGCDADFEYFSDYGSVGATQNRIESVINTMNNQYESEVAITHAITTILVRTSPSQPYTSTDAATLLGQFRSEWNANQAGTPRDAAQLFTGKEIQGGTIGIAWVGVVCNLSFAYSMVQSDFSGAFSSATDLSAHELGHNWSADHCNCTSNTMNPFITSANTFHPTLTIPEITSYRDNASCLDGGGPGGGDPTSVHVAAIVPGLINLGKGEKQGAATVTIVDDQGNPVGGAEVSVAFSGGASGSDTGTTSGNGTVTLTASSSSKGKLSFTVCVTGVSASLPYAPGDNVEGCDSN